jgi:glycosyltransferase involved in cell wall biosynthesis
MITLNLDGKQKVEEKIGNIQVYRIGTTGKFSKLMYPFAASRFAEKLHREKKYDAIWSIMASFSGFAALFFKKKHDDVAFILTLQEGDPIDYIKKQVQLVYFWFKQIFVKADKIQTISSYLANWARDMRATAQITVIPNGVDLTLFTKKFSEAELGQLKQELNKQPEDIFLITTSRLVEKNGVADIIKSLVHLPDTTKFLVIGDGPLRQDLEKLSVAGGVQDRVRFLGQKNYAELPKYLGVSDIFIRPSLSEGMGNSFIEAMAAGVPVIGTPVGGIPDFLKHEETGLFCHVENPQSIADQVTKLIEDTTLRTTLVANAQKLVSENYDWSHIADRMRKEILA